MRYGFVGWAFAGLTAAAAPGATTHDGLKLVVSESFPAGAKETTEYVASDRARTEWRFSSRAPDGRAEEHGYVQIRRCDLDKVVFLNVADRTYQTAPLQFQFNAIERAALLLGRRERHRQRTPDIVVETTTVDTGERRVAFGRSARRVITTLRQFNASDPDAADETVTDGWYIDLDTHLSCERAEVRRGRAVLIGGALPTDARLESPRVAFRDIGQAEEGFPIDTTITFNITGQEALPQTGPTVTRRVVTHLSRQPLDARLFDIPSGFRSEDRRSSQLAAGWSRTAHIIRSMVASWFR